MTREIQRAPVPGSSLRRTDAAAVGLLIALCAILFGFGLGDRSLWDNDEGMHAAMSREMIESGDWVTPRVNGEPFYGKPVLYPWLVALSFRAFGLTELAARLPSATLGTLCVLLTFALGRAALGRRAGLLGAVVLATSVEYVVMSRVVVHDIAFAFCTTLALVAWWRAFRGSGSRVANLAVFYLAAGLAVLAKGPLGLVLLGLAILPCLAIERRLGFLLRMGIPWGAVLFLAIAAPWYVSMALRHPDYLRYFLIEQNLASFASSQPTHPEPFWFYVVAIFGGLLPWSALVPAAVREAVRGGSDPERRAGLRFLLAWSAAMLLFFSAASSKLLPYVLPMFPAAALLIGWAWDRLLGDPTPGRRRWFRVSLTATGVLVASAVSWIATRDLDSLRARYDLDLSTVFIPIGLLVGTTLLAAVLFLLGRHRSSFAALAAATVLLIPATISLAIPSIDPYRTSIESARLFDAVLADGEPMVHYRRLRDSALFYADRNAIVLRSPEQLEERIRAPRPFYCLIELERVEEMPWLSECTDIVVREGGKVILWNRVGPEPPRPRGERP